MQIAEIDFISARKRHSGRWVAVTIISSVVAALGSALAFTAGHAGHELFFATATLFILMVGYCAFFMTSFATDLWLLGYRGRLQKFAPVGFVVAIYVFFAFGTGTFLWQSLLAITTFVFSPLLLASFASRNATPQWVDWLAIALIWLPFDLGLLRQVWLWPLGTGAYVLNTAVAVSLAIYLFSSIRRLPGIGFRLQWSRGDLKIVIGYFLLFCALAIPFGLVTEFIELNIRGEFLKGVLAPVGIFLFIAYPEELLFRGLLQNFLSQKLSNDTVALIIAAVFFGATHLNNGAVPDWRYFVLATAAGLIYGAAYIKTKNLLVPAIIHALVDAVWMQFLMKGA